MSNYSWASGKSIPDVANGHIFDKCNFHQRLPHTPIFTGKTGLAFRRCNLINCDLPIGSVVEESLNIHVEYCSNLHPEWVDMPQCVVNCEHVVDTDEIVVDNEVVQTIYHYADKAVT